VKYLSFHDYAKSNSIIELAFAIWLCINANEEAKQTRRIEHSD
jgi:hypothetical protein